MAFDINLVVVVGRLTRDVEIKYSASGVAVASFSIANSQSKKDGENWVEESHFFNAVMIGKRADAISAYLKKGQQVAIQGVLQQNRWQDKQSGQNRSQVEIFVSNLQLVGGRQDGAGAAGSANANKEGAGGYNKPSQFNKTNESPANTIKDKEPSADDPFDDMDFNSDEEIPF